jgi:signal transduction histidine kinase
VKRPDVRFWAASVVVGLASVALLLVTHDPVVAPHTHVTLAAVVAVAWSAAMAVAWSRYRSSSDPHVLFLSAGCAVLAAGSLFYGVAYSFALDLPQVLFREELSSIVPIRRVSPLSVLGWQLTWVIAAGCFVFALPWRDRRGRPPVQPGAVFGDVILALAASLPVAFLVADVLQERPAWEGFNIALPGMDRFALGAVGWIIGGATVIPLLVAAFREDARGAQVRSVHPWLAGAFLLAVPMHAGVVHHPLQGMGFLTWADALQPVVPAIVLTGLLVSQHEEVSRVRRATDRAAEVMGGRAEIASVLAHDVRSPVATIKSLATTTTQSYDRLSDAERTEFIGLIEQEASRLLETVNQASLALKVDAGTVVHERRPVDLATVVREGIEAARKAGHYLTVELAPGVTVSADRRHLAEAVRQLVDNAAKFSPADAPIRVTSGSRDGRATIEVTDGGPGIPPERRAEVVARFANWRPEGYEDRTGAGLGLFICRGIVAEHGGELVIDEAPGGGTILRIRFPLEG